MKTQRKSLRRQLYLSERYIKLKNVGYATWKYESQFYTCHFTVNLKSNDSKPFNEGGPQGLIISVSPLHLLYSADAIVGANDTVNGG